MSTVFNLNFQRMVTDNNDNNNDNNNYGTYNIIVLIQSCSKHFTKIGKEFIHVKIN